MDAFSRAAIPPNTDLPAAQADDATVSDMAAAAERAGVRRLVDLGDADKLNAVVAELARAGVGAGAIRSQIGYRAPGPGPEVALPSVLQVFGQRFVIDWPLARLTIQARTSAFEVL